MKSLKKKIFKNLKIKHILNFDKNIFFEYYFWIISDYIDVYFAEEILDKLLFPDNGIILWELIHGKK